MCLFLGSSRRAAIGARRSPRFLPADLSTSQMFLLRSTGCLPQPHRARAGFVHFVPQSPVNPSSAWGPGLVKITQALQSRGSVSAEGSSLCLGTSGYGLLQKGAPGGGECARVLPRTPHLGTTCLETGPCKSGGVARTWFVQS